MNCCTLFAVATYKKISRTHEPGQSSWTAETRVGIRCQWQERFHLQEMGDIFNRRADLGAKIIRCGRISKGKNRVGDREKCAKDEKNAKKEFSCSQG